MWKKTILSFLGMGCVMFLFSATAFGLDLNPGKYEITSKVEMPGMPVSVPPTTITQCITKEDPVPKQDESSNCKIKNMKQTGNSVSWDMECDQQGQKMTSSGEMSYSGDTFKGTVTAKMGAQAGNMTMTMKMTGKRIGGCDKTKK